MPLPARCRASFAMEVSVMCVQSNVEIQITNPCSAPSDAVQEVVLVGARSGNKRNSTKHNSIFVHTGCF